MKRYALAIAAAIAAVVVAGCTSTPATDDSSTQPNRAVVLVSGGATSSPFTTPTQACKDGEGYLAAGNTDIRSYLLQMGKQVYTAPVMDTWGPVVEPTDDRPGPFTDCPLVLPATMTITSTADLTAGGERLARFLTYLNTEFGVTDVPDSIIPWRTCWEAPLLHTIYQSAALNLPWDTAMTNNTEAIARVNQAIDEADTALSTPNRQGC